MSIFKLTGKLSDITAKYLKERYLVDLELVRVDGSAWPDVAYENALRVALQKFQQYTQVIVSEKVVTREVHDYDVRDYSQWNFLKLFLLPVKSVEKFEVRFPSTEQYTEWPLQWVKLNPLDGQIQLLPTSGTISQMLMNGAQALPLMGGHYHYLPQLFHVSYTAGFKDDDIPIDIIDAICRLAVIELLTVAGDTVYKPGATSFSVSKDGVSQSIGILNNGRLPAVFGSRIGFYLTQLFGSQDTRQWNGTSGDLGVIRGQYHGNMSMVVA